MRWGDDSKIIAPPTGSLAGLRPYLTVGFPLGKPNLKGEVIPFSSRKSSLPLRQKCQPRRWMIALSPSSVGTIPHSSIGIDPQGGSDSQPRHSSACRNLGGGEIHWFWSTLRLPPTCAGMTAISPSSPGLTTHLPAFAVLREIAGFGIVRATRGNHSRCHAPSSGRAGVCCENRGGVLMESGVRTRVKTAIPRSGLIAVSREGVLIDSGVTRKTKIIQFPVNIDKFTSYFDKLLKSGR